MTLIIFDLLDRGWTLTEIIHGVQYCMLELERVKYISDGMSWGVCVNPGTWI